MVHLYNMIIVDLALHLNLVQNFSCSWGVQKLEIIKFHVTLTLLSEVWQSNAYWTTGTVIGKPGLSIVVIASK